MKIKQYLLAFLMLVTALGACKSDPGISAEEQLAADETRIKEFIATNNIPAVRHQSGLYYQIIEPGAGTLVYGANTSITAKYTLRLLNGNTVPQPAEPIQFSLGVLSWDGRSVFRLFKREVKFAFLFLQVMHTVLRLKMGSHLIRYWILMLNWLMLKINKFQK